MPDDLEPSTPARLRELVAALPEPIRVQWWETADPLGYHVEALGYTAGRIVLRAGEDMGATGDESAAIAAHIATFDPPAVLAVADLMEAVEQHKAAVHAEAGNICHDPIHLAADALDAALRRSQP